MADRWKAVYEAESGRLVSAGSIVADPLPDGLELKALPLGPPGEDVEWNESSREFVPRTERPEPTLDQVVGNLAPEQRQALQDALERTAE